MKSVEAITERALALKPGSIKDEDTSLTISEWDSLGHLKVLTELDIEFDGKLAEIEALADARSIREIKTILRAKGLLDG
jgi:acyl carrier protein